MQDSVRIYKDIFIRRMQHFTLSASCLSIDMCGGYNVVTSTTYLFPSITPDVNSMPPHEYSLGLGGYRMRY